MSQLQQTLARLANDFAASVLKAIASSSLADISSLAASAAGGAVAPAAPRKAPPPSPIGRWKGVRNPLRRGTDDLEAVIARVVATLKAGGAMSSEQLQRSLKLTKKDVARPIVLAVKRGTITKHGNKRSTRYSAA